MDKLNTKNAIRLSAIILALFLGIFIFLSVEDIFRAFKPYYFNAYKASVFYEIERSGKFFANKVGEIFTKASGKTDVEIESKYAESVPVLLYHGIVDEHDNSNTLLSDFRDQIFTLKEAGWNSVRLEEFIAFIKGQKKIPDKSFLLTFDDGRKDSYYPVDPFLAASDFSAVMFAITGRADENPFHLSTKEYEEMIKSGRWEIQSHGQNDHDLESIDQFEKTGRFLVNKLWLDQESRLESDQEFKRRVSEDLVNSKKSLEEKYNIKVNTFAYPFGDFGEGETNFIGVKNILLPLVREVYDFAFYQSWGGDFIHNYPSQENFMVKRIIVRPDWSGKDLLEIIERGRVKSLPFSDSFSSDRGWHKGWGRLSLHNEGLAIGSFDGGSSGLVILDGSYLWENYFFQSRIKLNKGDTFSLISRYENKDNYSVCAFFEDTVQIEQFREGDHVTISELKIDVDLKGEHVWGLAVIDSNISCYIDGQAILSGRIDAASTAKGGVGFKIWSDHGVSEMIIKSVDVNLL